MFGSRDLSPAPELIYELIEKRAQAKRDAEAARVPQAPRVFVAGDAVLARARRYLEKMSGAVAGSGGHDATYKAALALVCGFELSESDAFDLLAREYNPRCTPPWTEKELRHKVSDAGRSTLARGYLLGAAPARAPSAAWAELAGGPPHTDADAPARPLALTLADKATDAWLSGLPRSPSTNKLLVTTRAVAAILEHDPAWSGVIARDLFAQMLVVRKPPPFPRVASRYWTDSDEIEALCWFEQHAQRYNFHGEISAAVVERAIKAVAARNAFHPLQDKLNSLPAWDGVERLNTWLTDIFGAENNAYTRGVGRLQLIGAVWRAFVPGCQCDYMLILESEQGGQKTKSLAALAYEDEWFTSDIGDISKQQALERIQGRWIVEMGELAAMKPDEVETTRNFLTIRSDKFRVAWGKHVAVYPRQCIFFGTINPGAGGYLRDEENRRLWPVKCEVSRFNVARYDLLLEVRDQIWAEAIAAYRRGEVNKPSLELEALAVVEQDARRESDEWEAKIWEWTLRNPEGFTIGDVLVDALKIEIGKIDRRHELRVGRALRLMNFAKMRDRTGSGRKWAWYKRKVAQ